MRGISGANPERSRDRLPSVHADAKNALKSLPLQDQNLLSNSVNFCSRESSCCAFSLVATNCWHASESSRWHSARGRKPFASSHRLGPGKKLYSRLLRAERFKSAYERCCTSA